MLKKYLFGNEGLVKKYRGWGWAGAEKVRVISFEPLVSGWVVQFLATRRGWVILFLLWKIDAHLTQSTRRVTLFEQ